MNPESPAPAIERLSENDRWLMGRPTIKAVISGIKPAAFEDWGGRIQDLQGVRDYLSSIGIDALVLPNFIMDRAQVARRIANEPALAALIGWKEGMNIDLLAEPYKHGKATDEIHALTGFLVGYPTSAILGFRRARELRTQGVPEILPFYDADEFEQEEYRNVNADGLALFEAMSKDFANLPLLKWKMGPPRPSTDSIKPLWDKYRPAVIELYKRQWHLSEEDANLMAWRSSVQIKDADGGNLFEFATFGKDGDKAPDVLALREKVRLANYHN